MTQAERLFKRLRRRGYTYLELLMTGISTCPHKRMDEEQYKLHARGEFLERSKDQHGRVVFKVRRIYCERV